MTGRERARAKIRTHHEESEVIVGALVPDNTVEMETTVEGGEVRTRIARDSTAGLRSTTDDYVVNLAVAIETIAVADDVDEREESNDRTTETEDTQS